MSARFHRRLAVAGTTVLAAAALGVASAGQRSPERAAAAPHGAGPRPNIVLVMTDDQALTQTGSQYMPRVTRLLQDQGTSFENAFLTTPLCCPSRAALLTGQYGHNNGVLRNAYQALRGKRNVLPVWLQRAGYTTAHVGKFLNRYHHSGHETAVAPGWDQWFTELDKSQDTYYGWELSRNGRRVHYGAKPRDYAPRVFEQTAVHLVRRFVPRQRPLYLELDEIAPHPGPARAGAGCNPPPDPRDVGKFEGAKLPRPPSFNEPEIADKPSFLRSKAPLSPHEIDRRTKSYRCGLAALAEVDRTLARLYRQIKDLGELQRTVFIFYTDNGIFFGEHRVAGGKIYPYEEADRTPLLIRLPARYRNGAPRVDRVTAPVANIDLAPTILKLARARPCGTRCRVMDGRPLLGLLRGRSPPWASDRPLGVELRLLRVNARHAVCQYAGVRVPGAIFVRHTRIADPSGGGCVHDVQRERYDLSQDPFELHNLCFGGGACPTDAEQATLRRLLVKIRRCSGIRGRDPRPTHGSYCG
jgi:N-acetylglucosamine-6-sulfatase